MLATAAASRRSELSPAFQRLAGDSTRPPVAAATVESGVAAATRACSAARPGVATPGSSQSAATRQRPPEHYILITTKIFYAETIQQKLTL